MSMQWVLAVSLILFGLLATGCVSGQGGPPSRADFGFMVPMTGYEVPEPEEVPYEDEVARREFLRFYHQAYLGVMWAFHADHSTISPISEHGQAATAGHYAGQEAGHRDKQAYWAERGREYDPHDFIIRVEDFER